MRVRHRIELGMVFLEAEGEITLMDFQKGGNPIEKLLGVGCFSHKVLFNLKQVKYIDSSGIGWLVVSNKHFNHHGGVLILHSIPEPIAENLKTLGLDHLLHHAEDEAAARRLAQTKTPVMAC